MVNGGERFGFGLSPKARREREQQEAERIRQEAEERPRLSPEERAQRAVALERQVRGEMAEEIKRQKLAMRDPRRAFERSSNESPPQSIEEGAAKLENIVREHLREATERSRRGVIPGTRPESPRIARQEKAKEETAGRVRDIVNTRLRRELSGIPPEQGDPRVTMNPAVPDAAEREARARAEARKQVQERQEKRRKEQEQMKDTMMQRLKELRGGKEYPPLSNVENFEDDPNSLYRTIESVKAKQAARKERQRQLELAERIRREGREKKEKIPNRGARLINETLDSLGDAAEN